MKTDRLNVHADIYVYAYFGNNKSNVNVKNSLVQEIDF